jgi:hypothetical protein
MLNSSVELSGPPKGDDSIYVTFFALAFVVVTQRIGYNPHPDIYGGSTGAVALAPFIIYAIWLYLLLKGRLSPSKQGIIGWGILCVALIVASATQTVTSYLALVGIPAIYFPLCFSYDMSPSRLEMQAWTRCVSFLAIALSAAILLQFSIQFIAPGPRLFTWSWFWPRQWLIEFNVLNYFEYGVLRFKPNGFVFLESSASGQFLARCLLLLVASRKYIKWAPLVCVAILLSYSGGGVVVMVLVFTIWLRREAPLLIKTPNAGSMFLWLVGAFIIVAGFGTVVFATIDLTRFTARLNEFSSHTSSGYMRYNGPFEMLIYEILHRDFLTLLVGSGAGSFDNAASSAGVITFGSGWIKAFTEFGIVGLTGLCMVLYTAFYRTFRSPFVATVLLFQFMVLDGNVVVPQYVAIAWLLTGLVPQDWWSRERLLSLRTSRKMRSTRTKRRQHS